VGIRNTTGHALKSVIGTERSAKVGRAEKRIRRRMARRLDPQLVVKPKPAPKPRPRHIPSDPFSEFPEPSESRHELLIELHEVLKPRTYLEVGVHVGKSLALSRTRTIGIDPMFAVDREIECDVQLARTTSDEFFARTDPLAFFEGQPIDLAFIDGMHLAEFALRDFMNVEKYMSPTGVILLDDMLPRNALEASRERQTSAWAGDVFKVQDILLRLRPDLTIIPINTAPTGTVLVLGLDPTSTVLEEHYEQELALCLAPDPQEVADVWLHRTTAVNPKVLMQSEAWSRLVQLRDAPADPDALVAVLADLHD
jgi:hypothetical protein